MDRKRNGLLEASRPHDNGFDYTDESNFRQDPRQRMFEDEDTARDFLMAREWAESNQDKYLAIVGNIIKRYRETDKRQSVRSASIRMGCEHAHAIDAALGRLMLAEFPEMEGMIRLSKSRTDGFEWRAE